MTKKFEKIANKYSSPVLAVQIKGKWYKNSIKMFECTLPLMFHCLPSTVCRDELFPLQMLPTSDAYRLYAVSTPLCAFIRPELCDVKLLLYWRQVYSIQKHIFCCFFLPKFQFEH